MTAQHTCDDCGEALPTEQALRVHPCAAVIGRKKARAAHAIADPAQRFLDEDY